MNSEFEKKLSEQSLRPVPAAWRGGICELLNRIECLAMDSQPQARRSKCPPNPVRP